MNYFVGFGCDGDKSVRSRSRKSGFRSSMIDAGTGGRTGQGVTSVWTRGVDEQPVSMSNINKLLLFNFHCFSFFNIYFLHSGLRVCQ